MKYLWTLTLLLLLPALTACPSASTPPPVITSFTASPESLPAGGGETTLTWEVQGASTLTIDQGIGPVTGSSRTVTLSKSTTYTPPANVNAPQTALLRASSGALEASATITISPVGTEVDTTPPTVALSSDRTMLTAPGTVTLSAEASDDIGVSRVVFFEGDTRLGEVDSAPYRFERSFGTGETGTFGFTATAFDVAGNSSTSAPVTVTVRAPPSSGGSLLVEILGDGGPFTGGKVSVSGPGGFSRTLSASQMLENLVPGSYTVRAEDVRRVENGVESRLRASVGELVAVSLDRATPAASEASVQVRAGEETVVGVRYEEDPQSGTLWIPDYSAGQLLGYRRDSLGSSSSGPPDLALFGASSAQGIAFDTAGDLWVSDWDANQLRKYDFSEEIPAPVVVIRGGGALANPTALAFDEDGSLWVTNRGNATVVKYSAAQLAASGSPNPVLILSDDGSGNMDGPNGIAFDQAGRLWFANLFSGALYAYANPGNLSGAVNPSPDVILSSTLDSDPSLSFPSGLAFDAAGNLWVSNQAGNSLVRFSSEQLNASGTPEPTITITSESGSLTSPNGLAFDAGGNLWVSSGDKVVKYSAAQLAASGSPTPIVVLSGLGGLDQGFLAFNPPPAELPISQK